MSLTAKSQIYLRPDLQWGQTRASQPTMLRQIAESQMTGQLQASLHATRAPHHIRPMAGFVHNRTLPHQSTQNRLHNILGLGWRRYHIFKGVDPRDELLIA